jgi:hypothetical protein
MADKINALEFESKKRAIFDTVIRSTRVVGQTPYEPVLGVKVIPDINLLKRLSSNDLAQISISNWIFTEAGYGIWNLKVDMSNGQSVRASKYEHEPGKKSPSAQNIQKIETTIGADEKYIHNIKFTYRNGSTERVGPENAQFPAGRVETFTIDEDEQLLGVEMDYGLNYILGITWVKWRPLNEATPM